MATFTPQSWLKLETSRSWLARSNQRKLFLDGPHNLETLIDTIGGKKAASNRLDSLFVRLNAGYDDHYFAAGNEPDFQVPGYITGQTALIKHRKQYTGY